jgi:YHS domain-containing protein
MGLRTVVVAGGLGACLIGLVAVSSADDAPSASTSTGREIPAPFAPFEYLVGGWKGAGVPVANRVRGWSETHAWAWKFEKGAPVGLSVTMTENKVLSKGQLLYEPTTRRYVLGGSDAAGKPVLFSGTVDKAGKALTLERDKPTSTGAKQRLTLRPNANFVRYTLRVEEQEAGAPQFKPVIDTGLTKDGEAFASGSAAADAPKCIVTGGAATMTVTYQGKSYPLCCSGCRDEFNDNPEKYVKKLSLRSDSAAKGTAKPAPSRNKDDGAFDGLTDDPTPAAPKPSGAMKAAPTPSKSAAKPAPKGESGKSSDVSRAASLLRLGQNLEKSGKTAAALDYYRRVAKEYPDTPSAKTAAARIKTLEKE